MTRAERDTARDIDGEAFTGELVDHGEALELVPVGASIVNEVVGPHLVWAYGRQWPRT